MQDDRDAWLDDVRRWYYGGTPPAGDRLPAPATRDAPAARRSPPASDCAHQRKEAR